MHARPSPPTLRFATLAPPPSRAVIGTAGAGFSLNVQIPSPPYTEVVLFDHGYARVMLHNATALEWTFIEDVAGAVVDRMWIIQENQ